MIFRRKPMVVACLMALAATHSAYAQQSSSVDAKIEALQQQIEALKAEVNSKASISQVQQASASPGINMKPGKDLIFQLGDKSEVQIYGHVDLSYDEQTTGLSHAAGATGKNGYIADVSSNLSFFGLRGNRILNDDLKGVFQFETEVAYAATPGTSDTAADTTAQKFALGSRNSYIGLQSATFGAIKLGKTDTPYKSSTARMDPFASTVADYNSIMGNTGGDTRAEFDPRLPHSVWYESPKWAGWSFNALLSPGQNRSTNNEGYALGEPDCTGANNATCDDGSFGTAYSTSLVYEAGPLYATAAYELHKDVNRIGDELVTGNGSVGIRNESAFKIGVQYKFPTDTIVNLIYEKFKRDAITSSLDERSRNGTWLAVTQKVTRADDVSLGWAHAGNTPGEPLNGPGPAFTGITQVPGVSAPAPGQSTPDAANQYSIGFKHHFEGDRMTWYAVATELKNDQWGHYAIGVSGHGITTRNQDGSGNSFTGNTLKALSVGMTYDF
jgi:predicted porin